MTDFNGELSAPVIGTGASGDPYRPDMAGYILSWSDVTAVPSVNQPGTPAAINVAFQCDDVVLAQLEADNNYYVHWYEEIIDDGPQ